MNREEKNSKIKESIAETRARHNVLVCKTYEVKITKNKLSHEKKDALDALFREAKWLRNACIASGDPFSFDRDSKSIQVKIGDVFEERELKSLGSQMKQDIVDKVRSEIRGLATKKKKGQKVGTLKFKSYCNSVPLRQYSTTYKVHREDNTVQIQGLGKKRLKVRGLKQIPFDAEFSSAKLIRKPSGYYLHITVFEKPKNLNTTSTEKCGIDFGIEHNLTLDNGKIYDIYVPETKSVKMCSRKQNRSLTKGKKKGQNHRKRQQKLRAAYEKQNNKKKDIANKVVSDLINNYGTIAIQDEMIASWQKGLFGKAVQHSAMGFIKGKLIQNSKTIVVSRYFPSTKLCPVCNDRTKIPLTMRCYKCGHCGYYHPNRDQKSASLILREALYQVSAERRTQSLVEVGTNTVSKASDLPKPDGAASSCL